MIFYQILEFFDTQGNAITSQIVLFFDTCVNKLVALTGLSVTTLVTIGIGIFVVWSIIATILSKNGDRRQKRKLRKADLKLKKHIKQETDAIKSSDFYAETKRLFRSNQITKDNINAIVITLYFIKCERFATPGELKADNTESFKIFEWDLNQLGFKSVNPERLELFGKILFEDFHITIDHYDISGKHAIYRNKQVTAELFEEHRRSYLETGLKPSI